MIESTSGGTASHMRRRPACGTSFAAPKIQRLLLGLALYGSGARESGNRYIALRAHRNAWLSSNAGILACEAQRGIVVKKFGLPILEVYGRQRSRFNLPGAT